jgi:hypothetical protein
VNQGLQEGLEVLKQQKALAEALAQGRGEEVQGLKGQVKDLTGRLTEAEERVQQGELIRRKLHNTILVSMLNSYSKLGAELLLKGPHMGGCYDVLCCGMCRQKLIDRIWPQQCSVIRHASRHVHL